VTNLPPAWAFVVTAPIVFATGVMVAVESRRRTTDLPTLDDYRAAWALAQRAVRSALEDDRPQRRVDVVRDLAWIVLGPALAVRLLIHVGAAVAIRGGDPGELDARRVLASPVVSCNAFEDLQLRLATTCYGLFWLLMGSQNMDPAGRVFFAVQLAVLIIDPCPWAGARVLSNTQIMKLKDTERTEEA
jgi:hypothetical protein